MDIRKKIMIVDDNNTSLQIGKELLRDSYDVFPLPSAGKMFEALKKIKPDLILLDIKMPDMDGFEIIKILKADDAHANTPVIFLTASHLTTDAVEGFRLGAADYLTKPIRNPALIECVEKHLRAAEESDDGKPVILAVDDSPDVLKSIHTVLSDIYKVYTLPRPEKLREFLHKTTPDLFLLDFKMPVLSGLDLFPIIRDFPEHKATPIIFLTSDRSVDGVSVAITLGACDYIAKPFEAKLLREKIAKHIKIDTK
jgi:DNA-binding response OmpR family regulator